MKFYYVVSKELDGSWSFENEKTTEIFSDGNAVLDGQVIHPYGNGGGLPFILADERFANELREMFGEETL